LSHSRWNVLPPPPDLQLFAAAGFSSLLARVLFHRGITHPSQVQPFIAADASLCGDPSLLPGIPQAVSRLYRALLGSEKIAVYGDFDTDGVTATALMVEGLSLLQATAIPYIPHRVTEGYGLKTAALDSLRKQGVSLVISVDCGITAVEPIMKAKRSGLDVIVTDHHMPLAEIPLAAAVVDPRLPGSNYPFNDFSGAGVALKVLQALFRGMGREEQLDRLFDLAALGTVADLVPLVGENRYLVKHGLQRLNDSPRLGIQEMMAVAGLEAGSLDSDSISWTLAPRLNAAGRLDHAMASYRLLTTASQPEAQTLAVWLQQKNVERQDLTTRAMRVAREKLDSAIGPALIVGDNDFPAGICGLVAGRLSDEYYRPAVVVRTGGQFSSGSCRSIPEFSIIEAMNQYQIATGGFVHFGGHAQAAGFTMLTSDLPHFGDFLSGLATTQLAGVDLRPRIDVDAEVRLSELGGDVFPAIQKLSPFGRGNPPPTFISRHVEVVDCRTMGNGGDHLRLKLKQGGYLWDAVGFGLGCHESELGSLSDIVYNVEVDRWNGSARLRLNILDFGPDRQAASA
jgi:single-stranded-DNA-specific exonuclease